MQVSCLCMCSICICSWVHVWISVYPCMCVCVCLCMYMKSSEVNVSDFLQLLSTLNFDTGSLSELGVHRSTRLTSQWAPGIYLSLPNPKLELHYWKDITLLLQLGFWCSSRCPGFDSQNPLNSLQLSGIPIPWNLMPSSGYRKHQACVWYTDILAGKSSYTENKFFKLIN